MEISFGIPSSYEYMPYVKWISFGIMNACGLNGENIIRLQLAIEEATVNCIKHAYRIEGEGLIQYKFNFDNEKLSVLIEDFGKGIELGSLKPYDVNNISDIEEASGRGIFLIKSVADEFEIDSSPQGGTRVFILKYVWGDRVAAGT